MTKIIVTERAGFGTRRETITTYKTGAALERLIDETKLFYGPRFRVDVETSK
jgi:hypothetical protein